MPKLKQGLLQVYTGNGKGKTTAAIGQAVRAVGHGLKVYMVQFMKGQINYGELETAKRLYPDFMIEQFGRPDFVNPENPEKIDVELAERALEKAEKIVESGEWDIVILDEVNVALKYKLIKLENLLNLIKNKPQHVELILTGRYASREIITLADLVSEVKEIKHPHQKNIVSRTGIDY